jgi:hypothetical protein
MSTWGSCAARTRPWPTPDASPKISPRYGQEPRRRKAGRVAGGSRGVRCAGDKEVRRRTGKGPLRGARRADGPWSNGSVEGFVNKLKLVKRQGYGRAGFELLRARILAA